MVSKVCSVDVPVNAATGTLYFLKAPNFWYAGRKSPPHVLMQCASSTMKKLKRLSQLILSTRDNFGTNQLPLLQG